MSVLMPAELRLRVSRKLAGRMPALLPGVVPAAAAAVRPLMFAAAHVLAFLFRARSFFVVAAAATGFVLIVHVTSPAPAQAGLR
ncbi:hypothetical protein DSM19430T_18450 [Desulfovibrio psychrotolerans]|uniref:Uncharacterized protein n=1 Tax=Desulfovibrio psychrotolerans TaxID=415242 RepID=A0A7J0BVF6_9BACT|nr:hypothetical protein DSM19430T_18450 [Desulfovibrio psychrotolerans]